MTQEEILEYNKRCAEFLTISEEIKNELVAYPKQQYSPLCSYANAAYITDKEDNADNTVWNYCKFHSDWNWIMEVVEAIEKLGYYTKNECIRNVNYFNIYELKNNEETFYGSSNNSKKETVVQAINQFLIWYNEKSNSKNENYIQ